MIKTVHTDSQRAAAMGVTLNVDVDRQIVQIGHVRREGQWFAFYALLIAHAISRASPQWLTPQQLRQFGAWQRKKEASIGKEVARELKQLPKAVLRLIEHA